MNRSFDRVVARRCASFVLAAACAVQLARAQEELPPLPPLPAAALNGNVLVERHCSGPDAEGCTRETIVITRRSPLIQGNLVDLRTVRNAARQVKELIVAPPCSEECQVQTAAKFVGAGCPCAAAGECACAAKTACGSDCAVAATACKCCPCAAENTVEQGARQAHLQLGLQCGSDNCETQCGEDTCEGAKFLFRHVRHLEEADETEELNPIKLLQHIAGLVGERSAAVAALEVRKQADEQIGELYEAMSELMADNAAMDAKLEAVAEQRKLLEKVADLAAENARLKAHLELAAERAEVARQSAALALENERLKLHVVAMEQKHAIAEATRTAAKPKDRKVR
jgi:hypothetical protein